VATVNDGPISVESYRAQMAFMGLGNDPAVLTPGLRRAVLETMARRKLVLDQAQAKGIRLEPEEMDREEASLRRGLSEEAFERTLAAQGIEYYDWRRVMAQEVLVQKTLDLLITSQVRVSAEEVRSYYQEHRDEFRRPEQVLAQHALMPSKEMAQQLADRVSKGEDLGQAAARLEAPLADDGEPSWLERGHMPPSLESKVFALEPGKVAGPLPSNYGFHVVRVLAKRPAMELDLAQAAEEIQRRLSAQRKEAMASSLVEEMRASAKVWFDPGFEQSGKLGK
jgi:peptidyl-prolyl cis-trans isomerase C